MSDDRNASYWEGDTAVFRASALGQSLCVLTGGLLGLDPAPVPETVQSRFDEGHHWEPIILKEMERRGWEFQEGAAQSEHEIKVPGFNAIIRLHPDQVGRASHLAKPMTVEVKALGNDNYDQAVKKGTGSLPYGYDSQMTALLRCPTLPDRAIWVCANKHAGGEDKVLESLHFEEVASPPLSMGEFVVKVRDVMAWVQKGELPPGCMSFPCPWFHDHEEAEVGSDGDVVDEKTSKEIASWASIYHQRKKQEEVAKKKKEEARDKIIAALNGSGAKKVYAGGFMVRKDRSTSKRRDYKAIEKAGIDLSPYTTETHSERLTVESGWGVS